MITHFQRAIHRHGRWIFMILLGVVIITFLLWGAGDVFQGSRQTATAGTVYGRTIDLRELESAKRLFVFNLAFRSGGNFQLNRQTEALVEQASLRRMAMVEKARRLGITVSNEEVEAEIRPNFLKDGKMDETAYDRFVSEGLMPRGLTEEDFENMVYEDLLLEKLFNLVGSTVKVASRQVRAYTEELSENLTISTCRFEMSDFMKQVKPTEEQLVSFHRDHPDQFRTPAKVRVSYVTFPVQTSNVTISDQELQEVYEANRAMFASADGKVKPLKEVSISLRRQLAQEKAMQNAEKEAADFTIQLVPEPGKKISSFDVLAGEKSLMIKQTGFLAPNEQADGISTHEFTSVAFNLSPEIPVSDPVLSTNAVYVLHFLEQQPNSLPPYEQVKATVKTACVTDLALKLARETGDQKRRELIVMLESGKTFTQAADKLKLKPQTFKNFSQIDSLPKDPFETTARQASFQLAAGAVSDLIPNISGGFFVHVLSRQGAKMEEVAKLEPRIHQGLIQMQRQLLLQDFQQSVVDEALVKTASTESLPEDSVE